jgi:hypothetical protein
VVGGFLFRLGLDGHFSYDTAYDAANGGFLHGNGTSTLEFAGYEIRVDATQLSYQRVYIPG